MSEKEEKKEEYFRKLNAFGLDHYTFINGVLGDLALRRIIQEEFKSPSGWKLAVCDSGPEFLGSYHHYCLKGEGGEEEMWCSGDLGIQDTKIHPNDTLCQSYSIGVYMGTINTKRKLVLNRKLQEEMIKAWREILENKRVLEQIKDSVNLLDGNIVLNTETEKSSEGILKKEFVVYLNSLTTKKLKNLCILNDLAVWGPKKKLRKRLLAKTEYIVDVPLIYRKNPDRIITKINKVLDEWESYGWKYFAMNNKDHKYLEALIEEEKADSK